MAGTDAYRALQHLVSKGYQANFARTGRVCVLDARTGATLAPLQTVKENWRAKDFTTELGDDGSQDDSLEREFAKLERVVLNRIREIRLISMSEAQRQALDLLAAIHLVRSCSFVSRHGEATQDWLPRIVDELASNPRLHDILRNETGREPAAGELRALIQEYARAAEAKGEFDAPGAMRRGVARIPDILRRHHVQLISAPCWAPGFILPDCPVVHARPDEGRYGFAGDLAVGDASLIIVPVSRRLVAFYTARPLASFTLKTKRGIRAVNATLCRNAIAEIACHPDDAAETSRLIRAKEAYPASWLTDGRLK